VLPGAKSKTDDKNVALRDVYDQLCKEGVQGLQYCPCDTLLGTDGEATVDGTHPTDLGFVRMADAIEPFLKTALEKR
jgi:lysophospholipase L1-like esterase